MIMFSKKIHKIDKKPNLKFLGPMFHTIPLSDRLSKDDAKFVDIIHCAGLWVGMDEKVYFVQFNSNRGRLY